MNLSKAIEIITTFNEHHHASSLEEFKQALSLSVLAMKRIEQCRISDAALVELALPGETEE